MYCSLTILPFDIMYSETLKVLSESVNVWTCFYHFRFTSFRDHNLRFNLTCFDLQLDACDYNHLYIGANTGCVVHSLRSGGKPTPHFYIPNVGKFIQNWYFLSTCLGLQHDIYLLKLFSVLIFVIFICRWIYRSEVRRTLSIWWTLLSGEYSALKIKYGIIFSVSEGRSTRRLEETEKWRAPQIVLFIKYYNFKEDERGGACETYGKYEKYIHNFGWKV